MLVILCGKSASGKDTVREKLVDMFSYTRFLSVTTRPKRECETDGKEYRFVTQKEFQEMDMLESRAYPVTSENGENGMWLYGTPAEVLDKDKNYVAIKDPDGTELLKKYYGKENTLVVYLDVPECVRAVRAENRGSFRKEDWDKRAVTDSVNFEGFEGKADRIISYKDKCSAEEVANTVEFFRFFKENPGADESKFRFIGREAEYER